MQFQWLKIVSDNVSCRAPSGSDHVVRRWPQQEPCVHPTDNSAVSEVTGHVLDYTVHMCTIQAKKSTQTRTAKQVHHPLALPSTPAALCLWPACPAFPCEGGGSRSAPRPLGLGGVPPALLYSARSTASLRGTWQTGPRRPGRRARRYPWQRLALAITRRDARPRRLALEQRRQGIFRGISV